MSAEPLSTAPAEYSQDEWDTRVELAALYRVVNHYGMTYHANNSDMIYHVNPLCRMTDLWNCADL